ncbi:BMP family lipoprotein [Alkalibacillus haloalkaliphilus]|uniref:BMP family ABC transporter substrate-binding protein n=1 Tax=Alkalibacillus haloalkaliphilus TaxID=94136 RepID=A0A511W4T9_9BACI|nr:BMP family ABC transporter substrate-binding protein [Alkalibacillus haloalkaliphilus]GEN46119.1 BMP family ABC transporter substrate-binding protein [Alkalibacillus haloalkaliphilus]
MKLSRLITALLIIMTLIACSSETEQQEDETISAGLLVTESGLGDNAFSDLAFQGLAQARDELNVVFDYREPFDEEYERHLEELIEQEHDVIFGLSFSTAPAIEAMAETHPEQQFVIIDDVIDLPNVTSITFKEDEGSYLIGLIAGMRTESDVVGFIGGVDSEVIRTFEQGFVEGVEEANSDAEILIEYAGTFDDDQLGADIADNMIDEGADYLFPSAGFTGTGALQEAESEGIYAFGVDTDQYTIAEDAVVTSMVKNVNTAIYEVVESLQNGEVLNGEHLVLGLDEDGVGLAPIRVIELSTLEERTLEQAQDES